MKKLIRIFWEIVSIVVMMGTTVYAVTAYHMSLSYYMGNIHNKVVFFIMLMIINCVLMIYNNIRKYNKKIILTQQVIAILLIAYFSFKIYPFMLDVIREIVCVDAKKMLIITMFWGSVVGFILLVVLELIAWKNNEKTCHQFIIASIILVIAIITSITILDLGIEKDYNMYKKSNLYDVVSPQYN